MKNGTQERSALDGSWYDPYKMILGDQIGNDWFDLESPIPPTIKDPDDLQMMIREFSIIPAYGTTESSSHTFLEHLTELTQLSPSFNSAISDINSYAFGLNFDIRAVGIPGLALPAEGDELPYEEKLRYAGDLRSYGINLPDLISMSRVIHRHLRACGNAYLMLNRITVGDQVRYGFSVPHFTQAAYLKTLDPPYQFLILTRSWDTQYMMKYPPKVLPVTYPNDPQINWINTGGGIDEAVVHIRRNIGSDHSEFYGRTELLSCYDWLAADIFGASVISKIASTEITAKNIFAFQGPNPNAMREDSDDDEFFQRMASIRSLTTGEGHRGQAKSLAGFEYPWGSDAPVKLTLDVARDTEFAQFTQDYAANTIYSALNWSTQLSGFREVRTGLGSNVLRDLLITKQVSTIEPIQHEFEDLWNWSINLMLDDAGYRGEKHYLQYQNTVDSMIDKLGGGPLAQSSPENTILNDPIG